MENLTSGVGAQRLLSVKAELEIRYNQFVSQKLKLDMSRGKPAPKQLDLSNDAMGTPCAKTEAGVDARNYGILEGIPEMRRFLANLLGIGEESVLAAGNSSLNLMYDTLAWNMLFGTAGQKPWAQVEKRKFLCPSPGYDRHFAITGEMGFEMIPVPMTNDGPDMDVVEKLAASDSDIKGIWCVPLYSNPQGICYSDRTVERLASMKTAAKDFRIFWDNAYGVHHIYDAVPLKDILKAAEAAGNPDRVYYFFSTSKITFPGAGVAMMAASKAMIAEILSHMKFQTIGPDKLNQLRTLAFLKDPETVRAHMAKLAEQLRPKFEIVLNTLEKELAGSGMASWVPPKGGYFVAVDTLPGCAKNTVELARKAGVVLTPAGATFPNGNDPQDRNIRIAPTYPTVDELALAMELFCVCVKLAGVNKLLGNK